jgi:PAS domain S-box-containing protein
MIRVLVVDDEPMLLTSARLFLEESGAIRCETCASGAEALEKLPGTFFDAIVSDYEMPGMDGIRFLKQVRRMYPDLPFILFTGRGREEVVIDALNHGADFYVQKGFDPETQFAELIHKINHAVERARIKQAYQAQTEELAERMKELNCLYRVAEIFQEGDDLISSLQNVVEVISEGFQIPENTCARIVLDGRIFTSGNYHPSPTVLSSDIRVHGRQAGQIEVCFSGERVAPDEDLYLKEELMLIHSLAYRIGRVIERTHAEEALAHEKERLNVTLRSIGDGVIVTDTDGRVVSLNTVAEELTGWEEREAAGRPLTEVFHIINEKTGELCDNPAEKVIRTGQIVGLANHTALIARDGTLRVIADSGAPIKDARQDIVGVVLVFRDVTSEKRAEEERLRLASIVDSSNDAIFGTDLKLQVSSWNRGAERIYGYTVEEAIGRHVSEFAPPDRRAEFQGIVDRIREGKRVEHFETVRVRKTGETMHVAVTVSPLIDEDGDIIGYSAISRDITEKKRVEEELRESENQYRTIFETTGTAMMIVGNDGTISLANAEFERLFGYPRGKLEGRKFWKSFFVPEEHEKLRLWHHLRRKEPSSAPRTYESCLFDCTGGRRDILMTVSLIPGNTNSVVSIIDITGRKDAERALRESRERLNLIIEGAELATVDWNVVTGAVEFNERWAAMTGRTPDEIGGEIESWKQMLHPDDRPGVLNTLQEHLDGKTPHYETINRLPSKEGGWIWVHDMGKVVARDEAGRPLRMVGISRDVTGVRKYQEALNEVNKKLSLLASITRHDILNQVTGISGLVAILRKKDVSDDQKREYFDHIQQALTTIGKQIAFTRDYQDLGVHSPGWQPISELFEQAASNTPFRSIRLEVDTGTVEVFADPLLQRVFYNLLENSLRHGEDVTTIRVSFHENNHQAKLVVEDDGVGIPAAQKDGIFQKGVGKNKGYGLFLAREILDITGMSILETGEEGRGARFEIVIPRGKYRVADSLPD